MTVWTGQIIAASFFAAVLLWATVISVRRKILRQTRLWLLFGALALAGGVTTIVLTA